MFSTCQGSTAPQAKSKKGSHSPDPKTWVRVEYSSSQLTNTRGQIYQPRTNVSSPPRLGDF
ncbi:hypothetical protein LB507_003765 [Fusarium sp. FIESC RH6]|nr:hypothetical protein LB507_003765 [Fusarium sp. FIESC RH6]